MSFEYIFLTLKKICHKIKPRFKTCIKHAPIIPIKIIVIFIITDLNQTFLQDHKFTLCILDL